MNARSVEAAWYNDSWGYRKLLIVDNTKVSGSTDLTDFPILVNRTDTDWKDTANGGKVGKSDGTDILFTDINGKKLDHEIESYTASTGELVAWVRIPTLLASENTPIYIYYGNPSADDQQNAVGVWDSNYVGVWHLDETPANDVAGHFDSTANNNTGTPKNFDGTSTSTTDGTGQVNGADVFDGSNDYVDCGSDIARGFAALTASAWIKNRTLLGVDGIVGAWASQTDGNFLFRTNGADLQAYITNGVAQQGGNVGLTLSTEEWTHVVLTYDGATIIGYKNGIAGGTTYAQTGTLGERTINTSIGGSSDPSSSMSPFNGLIDEVRISNTARSADWIQTEYNNQNSPSTFFSTVASEEKGPGPVGWWSFNEGYGTTAQDGTSSNNDGTISSAAWANESSCLTGKCLQFDGSDDVVTVTNASAIDLDDELAGEVTFQTWVRVNSDGENDVGEIFDKGANTYLRTTNEGSDGYADLEAKLDLATTDATLTITNGITLNTWHHVAMAYTDDGDDEITVYIDGNDRGSSTDGDGAPAADANNLLIGGSSTANFHGFIDEFKIYKEERSAAEIKTDVQRGSALHGVSASFSDDPSYLSEGLVGHWKMDDAGIDAEGETITDASGNGNSGTLYGDNGVGDNGSGMDCTASGKYGTGCDFDGVDDYVSISDSPTLKGFNKLSVSFWIYPHASGVTDGILDKNRWAEWNVHTAGGQIKFEGKASSSSIQFRAGDQLTANQWTHVVVVYDGDFSGTNGKKIYYNSLNQSVTVLAESTGSIDSSTNVLYLGRMTDGRYYDGQIDNLRIYNRALSPSEVDRLYNHAPGPVAYYKMDEGSWTNDCSTDTVMDSSGNANHGDACPNSTGPTGGATGRFGKAGEFDGGDDYVNAGNDSSLDVTDAITISAWVFPSSFTPYDYFVSKGNATAYSMLAYSNTKLTMFAVIGGGWKQVVISSSAIPLNQWSYIAVTYDSSTHIGKAYIDSTETSNTLTGLGSYTIATTAQNLVIGATSTPNQYFNGLIDEVKIYNYARSPGQIIEDMNAGHPLPGSPVGSAVGHWSFDSGYGTVAQDTSDNNNDLTLSAASWTTSGKFGHGFTGADNTRLSKADDPDFDFSATAGLTLSTWFKRNTVSAAEYLIYKENGNEGYTLYMDADGDVVFGIGDTNSTSFPEESIGGTLSKNYDDNSWHHALAVKDGTSSIRLYVDGIEIASDTSLAVDATLENAGVLYVGDANATDGTDEFLGTIDEVKIYRAALTADQVKVDYNKGKAVVMGAVSTASDGSTADWSSSREYCIPGDTSTCDPPVAHWKMDENTGTGADAVKDISGNGNDGTMEASMTESDWVTGKHGSALDFDGVGDAVDVGTDNSLHDLGPLTFSAWFYGRSKGQSNGGRLFQTAPVGSGHKLFYWPGADNQLIFQVDYATADLYRYSAVVFPYNEWTLVSLTWDGSATATNIRIYRNGAEVTYGPGQNGTGALVSDSGQSFYIGNQPPGQDRAFDGLIDDVRIYDYARTAAQIAWEYNQGAPVAHYKLDECSGTTAYNSAKNANGEAAGNNGTITIGATGSNTSLGTCSSGVSTEAWNNGTSGKRNASLDFDDTDDYITVTDDNALDLTDGLSISAWVKTGADEADNVIVSKGTSYEMGIDASGNVYWDGVGAQADDGSAKVLTGTWHHVVITNNDTTATYYVDGKQTGTDSAGIDADNATALYIGYDGTNYFDGQIDDVKIFNYALTPLQIKTLYNSGAVYFGQ